VTPIRPHAVSDAQSAARPDPARQAQRAFFEAALGKTPAAAPATLAANAPAPTPVHRLPQAGEPAPTRILRPGSLLDIKV